jgi:alginate O-acetyltransferase complex protein AlgI
MLFNSLTFLAFALVFFPLYYLIHRRTLRGRNLLLLVASYVFYGAWDWRFLSLIVFTSVYDFVAALALTRARDSATRKMIVVASVSLSLGILAVFKYFNFFVTSFSDFLSAYTPFVVGDWTLRIVLPVGLSFYTFQSISYVVDVYRGTLQATRNLLDYAVYVALFPQLVAGPIERASHLLPQVARRLTVTAADVEAGTLLVLVGLTKKIVIADQVAPIADLFFSRPQVLGGLDAFVGALAFYVQIYADFSGYSDIARGLARLMGFNLMINFKLPYLAENPREFWQRWHISLSQWLRDYLYVPLGGSRHGGVRTFANLMVTMVLGGLWHGAAWNFVLWGMFHGALLSAYHAIRGSRHEEDRGKPIAIRFVNTLALNAAVLVGWILFRAESVAQIVEIATRLTLATTDFASAYWGKTVLLAAALWLHDLAACRARNMIFPLTWPLGARVVAYSAMIALMMIAGNEVGGQFIYFQF